jgi:hypothetical protein
MRTIARSVILATVSLCAAAAFAASRAVVNIPFDFTSQGKAFPAGQYVATLDVTHNILALNSATNTRLSAHWAAGPAESDPKDEQLILKFDDLGNGQTLRTIQLGSRITSKLNAPRHHHDAGSIVVASSGQ